MEYFLGLLSGVVFFVVLGAAVYVGYRAGRKKPKATKVDEIEKQERERFNKNFKELFAYNEQTALKKKVRNGE